MAAFQKAIDATDRTTLLSFTDSSQPIQIAVGDLSGVSVSVSGTWVGSLSFEGSVSGKSWSAIDVHLLSDNSKSATITATGQYGINPTPFSQIRIVPAVASGSALVELLAVKTSSFNWLSAIWKLISDRIPTLSNGKIPVEVGSLNVTVSNASLEIANDVGNPVPVTLLAESGYLTYRNTALTNTAVQVKASGGSVMGWNFINVNSVAVYVKFFNLASNVTVGTSPVFLTQAVPGGSSSNPGINFLEAGLIPQEVFSAGISIACVTGLADNSNTAPTTPIHTSVKYK